MNYLVAAVLLLLASGNLALVGLAPRHLLGSAYYTVTGSVFGVALLLGYGLAQPHPQGPDRALCYPLLTGAAAFVVARGLALYRANASLERIARPATVLAAWAGSVELVRQLLEVEGALPLAALALGMLSSSLLMGAALQAMLTGHWYLIHRKLDFWILRQANRVLVGAVVLKLATLAFTLLALGQSEARLQAALLSPTTVAGMVLVLRVLLGVVGVAGLSWMVGDCIDRRSNQSATGLLYVVVCAVLGGEGFAFGLVLLTGGWWL